MSSVFWKAPPAKLSSTPAVVFVDDAKRDRDRYDEAVLKFQDARANERVVRAELADVLEQLARARREKRDTKEWIAKRDKLLRRLSNAIVARVKADQHRSHTRHVLVLHEYRLSHPTLDVYSSLAPPRTPISKSAGGDRRRRKRAHKVASDRSV